MPSLSRWTILKRELKAILYLEPLWRSLFPLTILKRELKGYVFLMLYYITRLLNNTQKRTERVLNNRASGRNGIPRLQYSKENWKYPHGNHLAPRVTAHNTQKRTESSIGERNFLGDRGVRTILKRELKGCSSSLRTLVYVVETILKRELKASDNGAHWCRARQDNREQYSKENWK